MTMQYTTIINILRGVKCKIVHGVKKLKLQLWSWFTADEKEQEGDHVV